MKESRKFELARLKKKKEKQIHTRKSKYIKAVII